jgi:hypothetical protein
MKKVLDFIKKIYTIAKDWVVANGIEGVLGLVAGLLLWSLQNLRRIRLWCVCYT